jgi:RimJ/RimL family protein N-acetyltransferase
MADIGSGSRAAGRRGMNAPMLTTARLLLRDLAPEDWPAMLRIEGDEEAVRYQSYAPRTAEACRSYIARDLVHRAEERSCFDLAVVLRETGEMVGRVGLDIKVPERRIGELWFILDRTMWGRGLMPEAARALVEFGFRARDLHRVFLECDPRNRGAIRLAEKLGMKREGDLRAHVLVKGEWCGATFFGILTSEWRGRPP